MGFHIGPRVLRATGGSIDHKNGYRIHHFPPKITERGLVFNLDFGDKRCEPGWNGGSTDVFGDLSGNGRNFTRSGGEPWTSYAGGVRHFDGSNDYIYRTDTSLFTVGSKFTIEFSFRFETADTRQGLVSSHMSYGGSNQDAIELEIDSSNRLMTGFRRNPGTTFSQVTSGGLSTNTWYHAAMVVTGQQIYQYQNGSLIGSVGLTANSTIAVPTVTPTLVIGRYASHYLQGQMGYVRMYDRVLSPQEIARNYNAMQIRTKTSDYVDSFTPTCSGEKGKVEVLVVGSGGNGGGDVGGGGGGAQVVHNPSFTVSSEVGIAVTVGNIRLADQNSSNYAHGANGRDSAFSTISAMGGNGGRGRSSGGQNNNGYHGGGGSYDFAGNTSPSGGGNAGGDSAGRGTGNNGNGGGGGAGGVGETGTASVKGGDGAPGVVYDISGEPVAYGAGGAGSYYNTSGYRGYGGSSIGGDGGEGNSGGGTIGATNGRHGTGSGGGGQQSTGEPYNGGHGGHGTVIVRYPAEEYVMEVLVVAGGGGGGKSGGAGSDPAGGGGGGGGVIFKSNHKVISGKNYPVNVGTGGNGGTSSSAHSHNPNGVNSVFDDLTAIGGGGGGYANGTGLNGGSGGGGGGNTGPKGFGTPGQGNDGGVATNGGGGGGGAGAAGSDSSGATGGNGGVGLAFSISGTSTTYAGGGGGGGRLSNGAGTGGAGGGGNGGVGASAPQNGGSNTGGGGGGVSTHAQGGAGGSGVVIVAYKGPQRGEGGTVSTTARSGYTTHTFTAHGEDTFIA